MWRIPIPDCGRSTTGRLQAPALILAALGATISAGCSTLWGHAPPRSEDPPTASAWIDPGEPGSTVPRPQSGSFWAAPGARTSETGSPPPGPSTAPQGPRADPSLTRTAAPPVEDIPALEEAPPRAETTAGETNPTPAVPAVPPPAGEFPIDLTTALRLAEAENPLIGEARARIGEALGRLQQAWVELIPNLNAGASYDGHTGNLQRSSGEILNVYRQSVYAGGGARPLAAETVPIPAVLLNSQLANSLFDPLAARQQADQVRFTASATANAVLLEVATYYLELQGALAQMEMRRLTEADAAELTRITAEYARSGQGTPADAHRAETEWKLRQADIRDAEEDIAVASARLCRRLHLDPSVRVRPLGSPLAIYPLIDPATPAEELIQTALARRPEVQAGTAGLAASETRARQERARPFLPTVWLGFSGGVFGGGSNQNPPLIGNFRGRTDFDVWAIWTLQNFGLGNLARIKERDAQVGEAVGERALAVNQVRAEVASARGEVRARAEQIGLARRELADAEDGFRKELALIRQDAGVRPIEVTNLLKQLAQAREQFVGTIITYDQAQFRLFVALGSPPPLEAPAIAQTTPPPTATPPAPAPPPPPVADVGPEAPALPATVRTIGEVAAPDSGPPRAVQAADPVVAPLNQAHESALNAALAYEDAQERLRQELEVHSDGRSARLPEIQAAVAEAHRQAIRAEVAYLRALRQLSRQPRTSTRPALGSDRPKTDALLPASAEPNVKSSSQ